MNQQECVNLVQQVLEQADRQFNIHVAIPQMRIKTTFYQRGKFAGLAKYHPDPERIEVSFNEVLMRENPETFKNTVIHEVAHIVTHIMYPKAKQSHGVEFKWIMTQLGGNSNTYHNYDTKSVANKQKVYTYQCNCHTHEISAIMHNSIQVKGQKRWCNRCKTLLVFNGIWKYK